MNKDTYIIIPGYNEGKIIAQTLKEVGESFENVVFVDDGSKDNTFEEAAKTKALLVRHPINLGQGAAIQTGIKRALLDKDAKFFVTFDADGQHDIKDVKKMLTKIKEGNFDIIVGSRFLEKGSNIPAIKRVVLKLAVIFSNFTSGLRLTDAHNGLRVFDRKSAEGLKINLHGMSHASEFLSEIKRLNARYFEMPVNIHYTDYSKSKGQSIFNAVNIIFDLILSIFRSPKC